MATGIEAVRAATIEIGGVDAEQNARFALVSRPAQNPLALAAEVAAELAPLGARVGPLSVLESRILVVELPDRIFAADESAPFAAAYALAEQFDLAAAEPDVATYFPEVAPSADGKDPIREGGGGFPPGCWVPAEPDLDADPRWALDAIRIPQAWAYSVDQQRPSRGAGIVIAQPDTGVTEHAELRDVLRVPGFNILTGQPDPIDPLEGGLGNPGHGTGTASVVVSPVTGTVTGSAPAARHMPIRAIQSVIRIRQVTVARAIDWAVEHGAEVITMSLGGLFSFSLHSALRRAVDADVIVLAAAGNCVRLVVFPARYDECIAVAGTNRHDGHWPGSCRGAAVDIAAPGQNVLRASVPRGGMVDGSVGQGQGTSFAVALTAGAAACWLAHHGRANLVAAARARGETLQAMFRRLLRATARRPAGWDPFQFGAGVVDAEALLKADLDLGRDVEAVAPPPGRVAQAAVAVESLIAEAVDVHAVQGDPQWWYRFGPELSSLVLRQQLATPEIRAETTRSVAVSGQLAMAAVNPRLRDWLGLDESAQPEVGERDDD